MFGVLIFLFTDNDYLRIYRDFRDNPHKYIFGYDWRAVEAMKVLAAPK